MLPLQVQTVYQDLLQRVRSAPGVSIKGSTLKIEKGGRGYSIARIRIGDKVHEKSIGPDSAETRTKIEAAIREQTIHTEWDRENARLIAMLRSAGCLAPDQLTGKLLSALDRIGFFQSGGILGGTHAFRHYPLELGAVVPSSLYSMTGGVAIIAPSHIILAGDDGSPTARLSKLGRDLRTVFGLTGDDPQKWVIDGSIELEISSPVRRGGEATHRHAGVGERVQALRYLEYAFKDPIRAVSLYRSGISVTIPSPQRYALHKLLIAQLRKGEFLLKKQKDLNQAEWLILILAETRPYELWEAFDDLWTRGAKWRGL